MGTPLQFATIRTMAGLILRRAGAPIVVAWVMLTIVEVILQIALLTNPQVISILQGHLERPEATLVILTVLLNFTGMWRLALWRPLRRAILEGHSFRSTRSVLASARAIIPTALGLHITHQLLIFGAIALCLAFQAPLLFFILFPLQLVLYTVMYFGISRDLRPHEAYEPGIRAVRENWGITFATHTGVALLWMGFFNLIPPQALELGPVALISLYISLSFFTWLLTSALNLSLDERA